jgi:periplasmic protein TonB
MAGIARTRFAARPRAHEDEDGHVALGVCFAIAALAHAAFALGVHPARAVPRAVVVTELELVVPAPPAPTAPPAPAAPPAPTAPVPEPTAPAPRRGGARASAPAAARAGALLTARSDPDREQASGAPVDFVTDPSGGSYGSGVVSRGGSAELGIAGGRAAGTGNVPAAVSPAGRGDGLTPAANLSRAARLTEPDACRGYYPPDTTFDVGQVTVTVVVRAGGEASSVAVLAESPSGQGFGQAARACLLSTRFSPALDKGGRAVSTAATIHVRFSR